MKFTCRAALLLFTLVSFVSTAFAAQIHGPAGTYDELLALTQSASDGDTLLISGYLLADSAAPLTAPIRLNITSNGEAASISGLHIENASVTFNNIRFTDTLSVAGHSNVELQNDVQVSGAGGQSGLVFSGSGSLIIGRGCDVQGGAGSDGVLISHSYGDLYASLEGNILGGSGENGGAGVVVSPLGNYGTLMLSGSIRGGDGSSTGGNAVNLYTLGGNAFITIAAAVHGGDGNIGGNGIQIVSIADNASIGISGDICGGNGNSYGGNAVMLMNAVGDSSLNLSGSLSGGNFWESSGAPGQSLLIAGSSDMAHARVMNCLMQNGTYLGQSTPEADVTPLPMITASTDAVESLLTPESVPSPTPSPEPSAEPEFTPEPTDAPTPSETESPENTEPVLPENTDSEPEASEPSELIPSDPAPADSPSDIKSENL